MPRAANGIVSVDRNDAERALALRLFESLRNLILSGLWARGEKLPGTRLIAKDAGVSRWTAVMAIDLLSAEGLVECRKRSGTYVSWSGNGQIECVAGKKPACETTLQMPFALGASALDVFPLNVWRRIQSKSWQEIPLDALQAGFSAGWPGLRTAIAAHLAAARGINCTPAQVIVTPSAHAGTLLASEVLCLPGSIAWTEDPCHRGTHSALASAALAPFPLTVDREGLCVADGMRLAPRASLAVVSTSYQFPTGVRLSAARKRALLDWSRETGAYILENDVGCEFGADRVAALAAAPGASRVVYMNTFSTTVFPSLRLAYLVVPTALTDRFAAALQRFDRYATVPNQIVLADFITSGQFAKHLRRSREAITERRNTLTTALADDCADHLAPDPADCGTHLLVRFNRPTNDIAVANAAREAGLAVEPLSRFYTGERRDSGLLLGFAGFKPDVLRDASKLLAKTLATHASRNEMALAG
jgi:GntR family transcriptional regulator/MocR family aminotransferase